jgi:hypothetical protein
MHPLLFAAISLSVLTVFLGILGIRRKNSRH